MALERFRKRILPFQRTSSPSSPSAAAAAAAAIAASHAAAAAASAAATLALALALALALSSEALWGVAALRYVRVGVGDPDLRAPDRPLWLEALGRNVENPSKVFLVVAVGDLTVNGVQGAGAGSGRRER